MAKHEADPSTNPDSTKEMLGDLFIASEDFETYSLPEELRPLAKIYAELGQSLFYIGYRTEQDGNVERARRYYNDAAQAFLSGLREDEESGELWLQLAVAREAQGENASALQSYLQAVSLRIRFAERILTKAHHVLDRDLAWSLKESEEKLKDLIKDPSTDQESKAAILNFLGRGSLMRQEFSHAIALFNQAFKHNPNSYYVMEGLADALWREGQASEAIEAIRKAIDISDQRKVPEHQALTRLRLANYLIEQKEFHEAQPLILESLALGDYYTFDLHLASAKCALGLGKPEEALTLVKQIQEDPSPPAELRLEAMTIHAEALYHLAEYSASAEVAEEVLSEDSTSLRALGIQGRALIAGEIDPDKGIQLVRVYTQQEPLALSQVWREILDAQPDNGFARLNLADSLHKLGELEEALSEVDQAIRQLPKGDSKTIGAKRYPEAPAQRLKAELLEELERQEEAALWYYEAGRRYSWRNEFTAARTLLERALGLNDQHFRTYWYLADTLRMLSYEAPELEEKSTLLQESLRSWEAGTALTLHPPGDGKPTSRPISGLEPGDSWTYITRALINEQLATLPGANSLDLYWEAVVYLERALLLREQEAHRWAYLARYHRLIGTEASAVQAAGQAIAIEGDNLAALEERGAILSNVGRFSEAEQVIDRRRELEPNLWADGVKAYILFHQDRFQEAWDLIDQVMASDPAQAESIWNVNFRAYCKRALKNKEAALEDYRWILKRFNPDDQENLSTFADAAFQLGEYDRALELYQQVWELPAEHKDDIQRDLGWCYLAMGDKKRGLPLFLEGVENALNARQMEDLFRLGIMEVEEGLLEWPYDDETRAEILEQIKAAARARIDREQRPSGPEEEHALAVAELQSTTNRLEKQGQQGSWAWLGAQTGLARLQAADEAWYAAGGIYQSLLHYTIQFPEASIGLDSVVEGLKNQGDDLIKERDLESALESFTKAHSLAVAAQPEDFQSQADLMTRLGLAHLSLNNQELAQTNFSRAFELHRELGTAEPGVSVGSTCWPLIPDIATYWALVKSWSDIATSSTTDERLRNDLTTSREALREYLNKAFQLGADSVEKSRLLPVVNPIAVEMGSGLIPDNPDSDWELLKTYLPDMRAGVHNQYGVKIPGVRIRANEEFALDEYVIYLEEVPIVRGNLKLDWLYCRAPEDTMYKLGIPYGDLSPAEDPVTREPGCWVDPNYLEIITNNNLDYWKDHLQYMVRHIEAVVENHLSNFLVIQEIYNLMEEWQKEEDPEGLIDALKNQPSEIFLLGDLLRSLVDEKVSIKLWKEILVTLQEVGPNRSNFDEILRQIRMRLQEHLPGNKPHVKRVLVPKSIEDQILEWSTLKDGKSVAVIPPESTQMLLQEFRTIVGTDDSNLALVTEEARPRILIKQLLDLEFPNVILISKEEVFSNLKIESTYAQ